MNNAEGGQGNAQKRNLEGITEEEELIETTKSKKRKVINKYTFDFWLILSYLILSYKK
jgi:hypothetical protein